MKNSNDTIGNRTRNLPACSAVSRTTALILKSLGLLYLDSAHQNIWNVLCQNMDYAALIRNHIDSPYLRIVFSL